MAEVRIADVYNPLVFNQAVQEAAIELNAFSASGIMVGDSQMNALASGPGNIGDLPFYFGLDNPQGDGTNEPEYVNDDPSDVSTPAKVTDEKMIYRKAHMHKSWSTMDLARELALADPLGAITGRIGKYWAVNNEQRLISSAVGVMLDNIANDANDMVHVIYEDLAVGSLDADNYISPNAVIAAKATMGDHANNLTAIAMHSVPFSELQRQEVIIYEKAAGTNIQFPTYLGYRVVVDDSLPVIAGSNTPMYVSVLFASGAFAEGIGTPMVPSELDRVPGAGFGGGQDVIHSRQTRIIHPVGFSFLSAAITGQSADFSELATAAEWNRVYANRKNIGMAFLQSNG